MSLKDLVSVSVSVSALSPSQANFGTPCVLAYHLVGVGGSLVRSYSDMDDVVADGHLPSSGVYQILQRMFSQPVCPPVIKVGRRQTAWRQTIDFAPLVLVNGFVYSFTINNELVTYQVEPTPGVATGTAGPWALTSGQTLIATLDTGVATVTFTGTAASITGANASYAVLGAPANLHLAVNGTPVVVAFAGTEHDETTYRATIDGALGALGATSDASGQIRIATALQGTSAVIAITAADAGVLDAIGMNPSGAHGPPVLVAGGGNVANIGAVTGAEFQSLMQAQLTAGPGGTATLNGSNLPVVTSPTLGGASSVTMSGTARATMGFDTAAHTGITPSTASVCTDLAAAINALSPAPVSADGTSGTHVRCTVVGDGQIATYAAEDPVLNPLAGQFATTDSSPVAGLVADLNAAIAADGSWYGLVVDAQSQAVIEAAAAIVEANRLIYVADTSDTAVTDPTSDSDVGAYLQAHEYARTFLEYHEDLYCYAAAGLLATRLTVQPGSDTWAYKQIAGVRACVLSSQTSNALKAKNVNSYNLISGIGTTLWGISPAGEYMDIARGVDWFVAGVQTREFALFVANPKVPYTDPGIASIGNEIDAMFTLASSPQVNFIVPGTGVVKLPTAASAPDGDRVARVLNGVKFSGTLQGAIHQLNLSGVLSP